MHTYYSFLRDEDEICPEERPISFLLAKWRVAETHILPLLLARREDE